MPGILCTNCLEEMLENVSVDSSNEFTLEDGQSCTLKQLMSSLFPAMGSVLKNPYPFKLCSICVSNVVSSYNCRRRFETRCHPDSPLSSVIRLQTWLEHEKVSDDVDRDIKPNIDSLVAQCYDNEDDADTLSSSLVLSECFVNKDVPITSKRNVLGVEVRVERLDLDAVDLPSDQIDKVKCQLYQLMEANVSLRPRRSTRVRKLPMDMSQDFSDGDMEEDVDSSCEEDRDVDYDILSGDDDDEIAQMSTNGQAQHKLDSTMLGKHSKQKAHTPLSSDTVKNLKDQTVVFIKCLFPGCLRKRIRQLGLMIDHVHSTHGELGYFTCHVCEQALATTKSCLDNHFEIMHPGQSFSLCKSCGLTFAEESNLNEHFCQETLKAQRIDGCDKKDGQGFVCQCYLCEYSFPYFIDLKEHMYNVHDKEMSVLSLIGLVKNQKPHDKNESYICSICKSSFKYKRNRDVHFKKEHGDPMNSKKYKCGFEDCGKFYLHRTSLRVHIYKEHGQSAIICNVCAMPFPDEATIAGHVCPGYDDHEKRSNQATEVHKSELNPTASSEQINCSFSDEYYMEKKKEVKERNFICEVCGKTFVLLKELKTHGIRVHVSRQCPECPLTCTGAVQFRNHMLTHKDPKRLTSQCNLCPMTFRDQFALKGHLNRTHNTEPLFPCPLCGKLLKNQLSVCIHLQRMHQGPEGEAHEAALKLQTKGQELTEIPAPFNGKCPKCPLSFASVVPLKNHMKTHDDSKYLKHSCDLCPMTFGQMKHLKRHMLSHDPEGRFSCALCSKSFKESQNVYMHLRKLHPGPEGEAALIELRLHVRQQNKLKRSKTK